MYFPRRKYLNSYTPSGLACTLSPTWKSEVARADSAVQSRRGITRAWNSTKRQSRRREMRVSAPNACRYSETRSLARNESTCSRELDRQSGHVNILVPLSGYNPTALRSRPNWFRIDTTPENSFFSVLLSAASSRTMKSGCCKGNGIS